jgi:hypothetical protein
MGGKLVNLGRERLRRERHRKQALRRERENQTRFRKISAIALMFLKRAIELGHHNLTLLFAIGPARYRLSIERFGKDAPPKPPKAPGPGAG